MKGPLRNSGTGFVLAPLPGGERQAAADASGAAEREDESEEHEGKCCSSEREPLCHTRRLQAVSTSWMSDGPRYTRPVSTWTAHAP